MALYERLDGVPQMRESLVVYLDVLGIKHAYRADARATAAVLDRTLKDFAHLYTLRPSSSSGAFGYEGMAIYDSITIALPWDDPSGRGVLPWLLEGVQLLQASLVWVQEGPLDGPVARGALARGLHFMDDTFVGGSALTEAVAAESARCGNPWRDRPVVRVLDDALPQPGSNVPGPMGALAWCDNEAFVNYLGVLAPTPATPPFCRGDGSGGELAHGLSRHRAVVRAGLARFAGKPPEAKYRWLGGYHNAFCETVGLAEARVPGVPADTAIRFTDQALP